MPAPPSQTSGVGAGLSFTGTRLQAGNGSSPETFTTICNLSDATLPLKAETADVTNAGDLWRRRISTLLDMGTIKFKVFFIPTEATHENSVSGVIRGIRYLLVNQTLTNFKLIYPDATSSTDYFAAYVTGFNETGKVGDVFTAEIELSNNGAPVLQ
jgi:hypothetical protein